MEIEFPFQSLSQKYNNSITGHHFGILWIKDILTANDMLHFISVAILSTNIVGNKRWKLYFRIKNAIMKATAISTAYIHLFLAYC